MKDGLVCWCENCEEKFYYNDNNNHDFHEIYKLYEVKNGKKVRDEE